MMRDIQSKKLLITLLFVLGCISVQISEEAPIMEPEVQVNRLYPYQSEKMSNITAAEWDNFARLIYEAEGIYQPSELNSIAKYIYAGMQRFQPSMHWSVYVLSSDTDRAAYDGWTTSNKYLWKTHHGRYDLTYVSFARALCPGPLSGPGTAQFGDSVVQINRDKIKQIVRNSVVYRGDDIEGAAQYVKQKMGQIVLGLWNAVITAPNTKLGLYECRVVEWWVYLRGFGDLGWNYYLSKN